MASQADLGLSVEVVDIHRLPVRPEGVCHLFAFHPLQPLRVLRPDLLDPLRLLQRGQRFSLAPGEGGAVL